MPCISTPGAASKAGSSVRAAPRAAGRSPPAGCPVSAGCSRCSRVGGCRGMTPLSGLTAAGRTVPRRRRSRGDAGGARGLPADAAATAGSLRSCWRMALSPRPESSSGGRSSASSGCGSLPLMRRQSVLTPPVAPAAAAVVAAAAASTTRLKGASRYRWTRGSCWRKSSAAFSDNTSCQTMRGSHA